MRISEAANFTVKDGEIKSFSPHRETAQAICDYLKVRSLTPTDASTDPIVLAARKFTRLHKMESKALSRQLLATRLGVTTKTLDQNKSFEQFARKNCLYNYLAAYDHTLKVEDDQISIMQDGTYQLWTKAPEGPPANYKENHVPWVYGQQGLQNKNLYEWTSLEPFKKDDPNKWGNQYVFEFCACKTEKGLKGVFTGTHSWLRLYTPEGDIYSVGLYTPGKGSFSDVLTFPFRTRKGHLMSPDISEFWPCESKSIQKSITKEDFFKIKTSIEKDKKEEKDIHFQTFHRNCVRYIKSKAELAEIEIPTKTTFFSVIIPKTIIEKVPEIIRDILFLIAAIFVNAVQLLLGACFVDKEVKEGKAALTPCDLFSPRKSLIHHPHTLFSRTHDFVTRWRQENSTHEKPLNYELPPRKVWHRF